MHHECMWTGTYIGVACCFQGEVHHECMWTGTYIGVACCFQGEVHHECMWTGTYIGVACCFQGEAPSTAPVKGCDVVFRERCLLLRP